MADESLDELETLIDDSVEKDVTTDDDLDPEVVVVVGAKVEVLLEVD